MRWMFDTNIWIQHLKDPNGMIETRLLAVNDSDIGLCSIVKGELWFGAEKYGRRERRLAALDRIFARFDSLPYDDLAARHYARIRHVLETRGESIGPSDLKIAAICLANDVTLVSNNTREFSRVPDLKVEDWTKPAEE